MSAIDDNINEIKGKFWEVMEMTKMTKCPICGKVTKAKKFGVIRFLILLGFGIVPGVLYVLWYAIKSNKCMHCGVKF